MSWLRFVRAGSLTAIALIFAMFAADAAAQKIRIGRQARRSEPPAGQDKGDVPEEYKDTPPVLRFKMNDIDGKEIDLKQYHGNVIMMVNVASKCGYTPQYKDLQEIYGRYKDQGFVVLAFPSNEFGEQEPGNAEEIKKFCTDKYKVAFQLFEKVQVKEKETACELYKLLVDKKSNPQHGGDIKWNFTKFLINRKGEIVTRYESRVAPTEPRVVKRIESLLKQKAPKGLEDKMTGGDSAGDKDDDAKPEGTGGEGDDGDGEKKEMDGAEKPEGADADDSVEKKSADDDAKKDDDGN